MMTTKIFHWFAALGFCFCFACDTAWGHGGGGFHGGGGGGFHGGGGGGSYHGGGLPGGGWHGGGGIAGGGWHAPGLPGGHAGGFGGFSGGPAGLGHLGPSHLPGIGHAPGSGWAGVASQGPGWHAAWGGHSLGWAGGAPGGGAFWAQAHPYPWYNGHWHNHWYGNGFGGYGGLRYPLAWGLAGWGLGSLWYSSGYVPYYNPYYAQGMAAAYNYAQPIPVPAVPPSVGPNTAGNNLTNAGNPDVDLAIEKFRAGDYAGALALVDGVIRAEPSDAAAHELRGLILFALDDYPQAAATLHSLLAVGPGWDWTTLSSLYPNMQIYQAQLKALERYVQIHPRQADARFLLAYHYLTQGHTVEAKEQLQAVMGLMPGDKLAANLLTMAGGASSSPTAAATTPSSGTESAPVLVSVLTGDWHAEREDGSTFHLNLSPDKTFTWNFKQQDHSENISGNYTLDNSILILQGKTNGAMVAQLSDVGGDRFMFKALGGPTDDPGLQFRR